MPTPAQKEIGTVYAIGRNFAEHARELGNEIPTDPVVFLKAASCVFDASPKTSSPKAIGLPSFTQDVHHEVEAVLWIAHSPKDSSTGSAWDAIGAVAVGIDVTARDLQNELKKKGLPWTLAKALKTFGPVGEWIELTGKGEAEKNVPFKLSLSVNGEVRQTGSSDQLLFSIPQLVSYLHERFELRRGDLIFTGTPSGVRAFLPGDELEAKLSYGNQVSLLSVRAEKV